MSKQSLLTRAIESLKADRAVLDLAIQKLEAQINPAAPKARKPKLRGLPEAAVTELAGKLAR